MTTDTFLPEGTTVNQGGGKYLKLKEGATKIRILTNTLIGRQDWDNSNPNDKKVFNTKVKQPAIDPKNPPKQFWGYAIWNYNEECLMPAQITQKTIQQAILDLYNNPDRGDPKGYDITINRVGAGKGDTKYTIQASPSKELTAEQKKAIESVEINMEALFDGGDPITEKSGIETEKDF